MNKLTPADLDKLDILHAEFSDAIKAAKLPAELEVFMRTEFAGFMGRTIEKYNGTGVMTSATTGAAY